MEPAPRSGDGVKKYTFSLDRVLRVRRAQQQVAAAELRARSAAAHRSEDEVLEMRERYETAVAANAGMRGVASAAIGVRQLAALHARSVLGAELAKETAARALDEQRAAWIAAKQRVSALESIDARQRAEHTRATIAQEDAAADDVVTSRYRRIR